MEVSAAKAMEATLAYPSDNNKETRSPVPQKAGQDLEIPKIHKMSKLQKEQTDKTAAAESTKEGRETDREFFFSQEGFREGLWKEELEAVNGALNAFMLTINSDLHFVIHEDTDVVMLQVVDRRDNSVVKEIPSHEMLDVLARIRESVGALLDEEA